MNRTPIGRLTTITFRDRNQKDEFGGEDDFHKVYNFMIVLTK